MRDSLTSVDHMLGQRQRRCPTTVLRSSEADTLARSCVVLGDFVVGRVESSIR